MKAKPFIYLILLACCFRALCIEPPSEAQILQEWKAFYKIHFNLDLNLSGVDIPPYREAYDRIIIIAGGITYEEIILAMRQEFEVLFANKYLPKYFDIHIKSNRNNEETYAIRVKENNDSGEIQRTSTGVEKFSVDSIKVLIINNITLMERLIYELKYFDETMNHLDIETFTVCAGSFFDRDSPELSPAVGWKTGRGSYFPPFLFISECYSLFTLDGLYSRSVVSF